MAGPRREIHTIYNDFSHLGKCKPVILLFWFFSPQVFINNMQFSRFNWNFLNTLKHNEIFHLDQYLVNVKSSTPLLIFTMALETV